VSLNGVTSLAPVAVLDVDPSCDDAVVVDDGLLDARAVDAAPAFVPRARDGLAVGIASDPSIFPSEWPVVAPVVEPGVVIEPDARSPAAPRPSRLGAVPFGGEIVPFGASDIPNRAARMLKSARFTRPS